MNLLQTTTTTDWSWILLPYALYLIVCMIILYLIIRFAVSSATSEQRKQAIITNRLLIEQMRNQGISEDKLNEIIKGK